MPVPPPINRVDVWAIKTETPSVRDRLPAYRKLLAFIRVAELHQRPDFAAHLIEQGKRVGLIRQAA